MCEARWSRRDTGRASARQNEENDTRHRRVREEAIVSRFEGSDPPIKPDQAKSATLSSKTKAMTTDIANPNHHFIFLDCETTGLSRHYDQIVQFAAIRNRS